MDAGSHFRSSPFRRIVDVDTVPVDDDARFAAPMGAALHGWWRSAAGDRPPARRLFDVTEHRGLVANLFLVERSGDDFVFRVRGEEVLHLLGGNKRARSVSAYPPDEYGHVLNGYYDRVLDSGRCWTCRGTLTYWKRSTILFQSIDCPLTDDAGVPRFVIGLIQSTGTVGGR